MTPDVNVLVAAFRDEHTHHSQARDWLIAACSQSAAIGLGASPFNGKSNGTLRLITAVMASFLRLVTNPRVFATPASTQQAVAFLDALLDCPGVTVLDPASTWQSLRQLCLAKSLTANAIPDAQIAVAVAQYSEVLATFDRDFLRLLPAEQLQMLTT